MKVAQGDPKGGAEKVYLLHGRTPAGLTYGWVPAPHYVLRAAYKNFTIFPPFDTHDQTKPPLGRKCFVRALCVCVCFVVAQAGNV